MSFVSFVSFVSLEFPGSGNIGGDGIKGKDRQRNGETMPRLEIANGSQRSTNDDPTLESHVKHEQAIEGLRR